MLRIRCLVVATALLWSGAATAAAFEIADYFQVKRVTQLVLSDDGKWLAYVVQRGSLATFADGMPAEEKRKIRAVYIYEMGDAGSGRPIDALAEAQQIAWVPKTRKLAFIARMSGNPQVHAYDIGTGAIGQLTDAEQPVASFKFSANGNRLAYTTQAAPQLATSYYQNFHKSGPGLIIDTDDISSHDFLNPTWGITSAPVVLHMKNLHSGVVKAADIPGDAMEYHWSPDSTRLSVAYVTQRIPGSPQAQSRTSLGIYRVATGSFDVLVQANGSVGDKEHIYFSGGEWLPGTSRLLLRRTTQTDAWATRSFPEWTVIDDTTRAPSADAIWRLIEIYVPRFMPTRDRILYEDTLRGVRNLYELGDEGPRLLSSLHGLQGSNSLHSITTDERVAAFVNERLARPQEIYVRIRHAPPRQLTHLNQDIAAKIRYTSREMSWRSIDGAIISGWLLEPDQSRYAAPWPAITHVHGGPSFAYPDAFAPYFPIWPYPFEVLASRGVAIFLPNYRGTKSYGREDAAPRRLEVEPVEDLISGISHLVSSGVADPARLGMTGQSHGAWLGPLAVTRMKSIRASSFAEGSANQVVNYALMSGYLNREVHDRLFGQSLYESPERYINSSADLHFKGVATAGLYEAGAYSEALLFLSLPKAARHFGVPTEFVIYPRMGHAPSTQEVQFESAYRNLDWFEFWLLDKDIDRMGTEEQMKRWRRMRDEHSRTQ